MTSLLLAFLAGVLTTLNPCVLPMLPLIFGGAFVQGRQGPLILASGLILSFTIIGVLVAGFGHSIGLNNNVIRLIAAALLLFAGLLLTNQIAQGIFARILAPLSSSANTVLSHASLEGNKGQFLLGLLLGAVWSPCVGPTLGAAMALASRGEALAEITVTMAVFSFGMASIFLAIAYGSRGMLAKRSQSLQALSKKARPVFGWMLILVGALILSGFDKLLEAQLLNFMPDWLIQLTTRY